MKKLLGEAVQIFFFLAAVCLVFYVGYFLTSG